MLAAIVFFAGCKKDNYPGGTVSPYISLLDVRDIYQGKDVTLNTDNMFGAENISGVVVSDHRGHNMPAGLLVMQDSRRLGQLRGIAVPIGAAAANYIPGDSVIIKVTGTVLKKIDGMLQLTGVSESNVRKVSSGNAIAIPVVKANAIRAAAAIYESTLLSVEKESFDPALPLNTTYAGSRKMNDASANLILHTEATASFANKPLPFLSDYKGILFNNTSDSIPQLWARRDSDIFIRTSVPPKVAAIVITGYLVDPQGTDANYEYVQCMATKDINFATNNFSLVTTNNAGASTPVGYPTAGWATGDLRTYKFDLTTGTVLKGQYFYVGGLKNIFGLGSTDISSSKWFSKTYATVAGDGFGTPTTNLLANSGNAGGIALFDLTNVTNDTIPIDVLWYGGAGMLYTAGPPEKGFKITNTDYYDINNTTATPYQPYMTMGTNTFKFPFPAATQYVKLGGTYNTTTGRWTATRTLTPVALTTTSTVSAIEGSTSLIQ